MRDPLFELVRLGLGFLAAGFPAFRNWPFRTAPELIKPAFRLLQKLVLAGALAEHDRNDGQVANFRQRAVNVARTGHQVRPGRKPVKK